MKMSARKTALIAAAGIIVAACASIFTCTALQKPKPVVITLVHPWNRPDQTQALAKAVAGFHSLNPGIQISMQEFDPARPGDGDVRIIKNPEELSGSFLDQPVPWTGEVWVLACRKDILDAVRKNLPNETDRLRTGQASPEDFRLLLDGISKLGKTPITLGNSHRWPFMLWIEHWAAATQGPDCVKNIPSAKDGPQTEQMQKLEAAWKELIEWKAKGWFGKSMWSEGWARGLMPLVSGDAAFALVSANYLGPIQKQNLANLEFVAFPRRSGESSWSVGSAIYIAIADGAEHAKEKRKLAAYLSSPGITEEMSRLTGMPFFSWDPKTKQSPFILPSWADAAISPNYEELSKKFSPMQ